MARHTKINLTDKSVGTLRRRIACDYGIPPRCVIIVGRVAGAGSRHLRDTDKLPAHVYVILHRKQAPTGIVKRRSNQARRAEEDTNTESDSETDSREMLCPSGGTDSETMEPTDDAWPAFDPWTDTWGTVQCI